MANRITQRDLEGAVSRLNIELGTPVEAYTRGLDGHYRANPGAYCLDGAYGGWALDQMVGTGGGTRNVLSRAPKATLYTAIWAMIEGVRAGKEARP